MLPQLGIFSNDNNGVVLFVSMLNKDNEPSLYELIKTGDELLLKGLDEPTTERSVGTIPSKKENF